MLHALPRGLRFLAATLFVAALSVCGAGAASAMDLDAARAQGILGEQTDGYVGVREGSPEAEALAAKVNEKRRAAYDEIARRNGTSPDAVGTLAAKRLIDRLPPGAWVLDATGAWKRKK